MSGLRHAVEDLLSHFLGASYARVDVHVGLRVHGLARGKQPFHLRAIRSEWASSVRRKACEDRVERDIEPDREAVEIYRGAIFEIHERAATRRNDGMTNREQQAQDFALDGTEIGFSLPSEDIGDGSAFTRFDQFVDILRSPTKPRRQRPCNRGFARRHEPDEVNFIGRHYACRPELVRPLTASDGSRAEAGEPLQLVEKTRIRHINGTRPCDRGGPGRASRRNGKGHREAVVAGRVHGTAT